MNFFFQAEDGIRDGHVTGVQTCALPISTSPLRSGSPDSTQSWPSLGAPGRKIVSGGASAAQIAPVIGDQAAEPIRVYAGKSSDRTLEQAVDAVLAELDRTAAWDRDALESGG